jgi:hypothetical protein
LIGRQGTNLAYAMCMGCPAPQQMIDNICHALRGPEAFEKGNLCYLDEYKKGNIKLICLGCSREFDNPHDIYCSDCRYSSLGVSVAPIGQCNGCNSFECICADLELEDMLAIDWLTDDDCDGVCGTCWYAYNCAGNDQYLQWT